jgi:hypothetical protein
MYLQNQTSSCPNCNRSIVFISDLPSCFACDQCAMLIRRKFAGLEPIFKVKLVPEDMTSLRIGTTGEYNQKNFKLTGRIRFETAGKYFNLWAAFSSDKTFYWLAEGYGFYSIFRKDPVIPDLRSTELLPGKSIKYIDGKSFYVDCINKVSSFSCEGEIPEEIIYPSSYINIDCSNDRKELVMIHAIDKQHIFGYSGHSSSFGELNFKETRDINEWI